MKKKLFVSLFVLLIGLCSCGNSKKSNIDIALNFKDYIDIDEEYSPTTITKLTEIKGVYCGHTTYLLLTKLDYNTENTTYYVYNLSTETLIGTYEGVVKLSDMLNIDVYYVLIANIMICTILMLKR